MDYLFLWYPSCDTCRKARKWLDEQGMRYEERHIVENNPSEEELKAWVHRSGMPLRSFFNTNGMAFRAMNLKERILTMSEEEQLRLLASDGMLVKRPLLIGKDWVLIGFHPDFWKNSCEQ